MTSQLTSASASQAGAPRQDLCPLCGSSVASLRFREEPHQVLDCEDCGLTYVSPRQEPADLIAEVYDEAYWTSSHPRERGYADYRADRELYLKTFRRRWDSLRSLFPESGRALDVGCAAGYFMEVLQGEGWQVLGLEPSRAIAVSAQQRLGDERVLVQPLHKVELPEQSFDLISLWDVLEHLSEPLEDLRRLRSWLRPGGRLVLETQDIRAPLARLLGKRWHHFKHREHLAHFHPGTLRRLLESAGLRVVDLRRRSAGKYVRGDFVVERSARVHPGLPRLLRPLLGGDWSAYVNLGDELIAIAEVDS